MEKASVPKFGSFKPKAKPVDPKAEASPRSDSGTRRGEREIPYHQHATRQELEDSGRKHREHASGSGNLLHERRPAPIWHHGPHDGSRVYTSEGTRHRSRREHSPHPRERDEDNESREAARERRKADRDRNRDRESGRKSAREPRDSDREAAHKSARELRDVDRYDTDLFFIDRRGDAKNVEYGSLHRYSVAAYHRTGYGKVLGISSDIKIDRETSTDKEVCLTNVRARRGAAKTPRLLTSKYGRSSGTRYRFILPSGKQSPNNEDDDYIDLSSTRKRKRGSQSPEPAIDYRSIEGKAKARPDDEDAAFATDSDDGDIDHDLDLAARQQGATFSKQLKAKPKDLDLWLQLIEHQGKLVKPGEEISTFTSSERRTLADLRMSIVREALAAIKKDEPGHEQLLLAMIEEGRFMWDSSKRAAKWQEALKECPASTLLWTRYLDYIQDNSTGFRFDACKEAYMKCLDLLSNATSQLKPDQADQAASIAQLQTYVLLRYTIFLREAGYQELSISIWQALLEWHYHMPPVLRENLMKDRLAAFEDFWDSECPRMGERNAQGWQVYYETNETDIRKPQQPPTEADQATTFNELVKAEAEWNENLHLSTTADDDAAVEDPFRYVMFSDIAEVIESCHSPSLGRTLVPAALCFLGLPAIPSGLNPASYATDLNSWYRDTHLAHVNRSPLAVETDFGVALAECRHETAGGLYEDAFRAGHLSDSETVNFVDCLLEQLLARSFDEGLAEYYLAFKWRAFGASATKTAKALLKIHPTSLRLYNAYALMLVVIGEGKDMQKPLQVWSTAINMRTSLPEEKQEDVVVLWHSRLLCLAKHTTDGRAPLSSLMMICESSGDTTMKQLKVRRELESGFDCMQLAGKFGHASLYADMLAWLAYLTAESPIDAALAIYQKYASLLVAGKVASELLIQYKANFINHHIARKQAYKPALLRETLDKYLQIFPSNSILLALRSRLADQDRLRALVKSTPTNLAHATKQPNIVQWFSQLKQDLRRSVASGVTENNIRATFSNAVQSPDSTIKHSPALWMAWLEWEYGRAKRAKVADKHSKLDALRRVKQVVLDGMRYIPWHKGFILAGIQCFQGREEGREQELRSWYEVIVERGMRVRYDVESAS